MQWPVGGAPFCQRCLGGETNDQPVVANDSLVVAGHAWNPALGRRDGRRRERAAAPRASFSVCREPVKAASMMILQKATSTQ